ncbi:MAG: hypothetical protein IKN69_01860 [Bacilli bacterium]|nr:hypothetical protein [Bacilli bacterium]
MKKKIRLVLPLLTLPLLTSCPPSDDSPRFDILNFDDKNSFSFNLDDGLDLNVAFGLYNKDEVFISHILNVQYAFFVSYPSNKVVDCIYEIKDNNKKCYYSYKKESKRGHRYYSKEATIHVDSKYFSSEENSIFVWLAYVKVYEEGRAQYAISELGYRSDYWTLYYSIDENKTVTVTKSAPYVDSESYSEEISSSSLSQISEASSEEALSQI